MSYNLYVADIYAAILAHVRKYIRSFPCGKLSPANENPHKTPKTSSRLIKQLKHTIMPNCRPAYVTVHTQETTDCRPEQALK